MPQGEFSIYYVLAVALADGAALLDQFTDERVADPALAGLRVKIYVHTDAEQLEAKFVGLATPVLGPRADQVAAACWRLMELPDVRVVPDLTVPG